MEALQKVHSIQLSFRVVMDAMARPGRIGMLPSSQKSNDYPEIRTPLSVLIDMFIDQATTFCTASDTGLALERAIIINTHARKVSPREANFIVIPDDIDARQAEKIIGYADGGSLLVPESGATVLMGCKRICEQTEKDTSASRGLHWVSIEGPGVQHAHVFGVDRIDWAWARNRREDEFPCGIEIILVDEEGRLVAIPRTSFVSLLAMEKSVS